MRQFRSLNTPSIGKGVTSNLIPALARIREITSTPKGLALKTLIRKKLSNGFAETENQIPVKKNDLRTLLPNRCSP